MLLAYKFKMLSMGIWVSYVLSCFAYSYLAFVGLDNWFYNLHGCLNHFGLDSYSHSLLYYYLNMDLVITSVVNLIIPTAFAEELSDPVMHPSFDPLLLDTSVGGLLVKDVIQHIHANNSMGVNLYLTPHGVSHVRGLVGMLNTLHEVQDTTRFTGDRVLLDFLSQAFKCEYHFNVDLASPTIEPIISYDLPLGRKPVLINTMNSGIYTFKSKVSSDFYIGSALSLRTRLVSHMANFAEGEGTTLHR